MDEQVRVVVYMVDIRRRRPQIVDQQRQEQAQVVAWEARAVPQRKPADRDAFDICAMRTAVLGRGDDLDPMAGAGLQQRKVERHAEQPGERAVQWIQRQHALFGFREDMADVHTTLALPLGY